MLFRGKQLFLNKAIIQFLELAPTYFTYALIFHSVNVLISPISLSCLISLTVHHCGHMTLSAAFI